MPFTPDHSNNFPKKFAVCGNCGQKGVYVLSLGTINQSLIRCKYCKLEKIIASPIWIGLENEARLIHHHCKKGGNNIPEIISQK